MNLHEYQAKTLFRAYGVDTPRRARMKPSPLPKPWAATFGSSKPKYTLAGVARQAASKSLKASMKCASTPAR